MEQLLLKANDVAETLGICRSKAYALIASGTLPSVRIGKSVRVPATALKEWVAAQIAASSAEGDASQKTDD